MAVLELAGQDVHARRADEVTDEGVPGLLEQLDRRADLHDLAQIHDHHPIRDRQRLGLVVGDVDHRARQLLVQLLQLRAQHPFQMRIDHGERLVEHDDVDVGADQAAAERDLLLAVGGQAGSAVLQRRGQLQKLRDLPHPDIDIGFRDAAIAQREGQVVVDGHGVVDHRELEDLRDVAPVGRQVGHVLAVEQHASLRWPQQPRDDVEQRGLAAAGRPEQGVGAAILPFDVELLERPVGIRCRVGHVAVAQVLEGDRRHGSAPQPATRLPDGSKNKARPTSA